MAQYDPLDGCVLQHLGTGFPCVSSVLVLRYVLGADLNVTVLQRRFDLHDVQSTRGNDNLDFVRIEFNLVEDFLRELSSELDGPVLLPISTH